MADVDELDSFDDQILALETALGAASGMAASFGEELARMQSGFTAASREAGTLTQGMNSGLRKAFDGVIFDGMRLSDALENVARTMVNAAYTAAIKPLTGQVGALIDSGISSVVSGFSAFENGGGFAQGRVMPFASGGVISGATQFPMRGGLGLMGEAGPEAIMPLKRGANGRLGVEVNGGGGSPTVVMNISTPDVAGFNRSQGQIAAQLSRMLGRGSRHV